MLLTVDVAKVHINNGNVFLIERNDDGTYSWICYQPNYNVQADCLDYADYSWADATSAKYSTIAEAIHSCNQY